MGHIRTTELQKIIIIIKEGGWTKPNDAHAGIHRRDIILYDDDTCSDVRDIQHATNIERIPRRNENRAKVGILITDKTNTSIFDDFGAFGRLKLKRHVMSRGAKWRPESK